MKCTNCGKNEVVFYYTSNVNGKITKQALCSECAEKLSAFENTEKMFSRSRHMFDNMFDRMLTSPFESFFGRDLFDDFALEMPVFSALPEFETEKEEKQQQKDEKKHTNADPVLVRKREINALRNQMKEAVKKEDFEKAATLRDKIHELEKEN